METRKAYSTDLTNEQWSHLRILLPKPQGKGRRRSSQEQRELVNAILYVIHTGCQWRELPHDFPNWQTVYGYYQSIVEAGVWEEVNTVLRRGVRQAAGRDPEPSVVIIDSQSVKTTEKKEIAAALMVAKGSKDGSDI
jgi:putative transposase